MKFQLAKYHRNVPDEDLLKDLHRIAKVLGKNKVTIEEYKEHGQYHPTTLCRRFGSWFKALEKAGLERTRTLGVSDEEYFENLEEVWIKLGRQPRYAEMVKPFSRYCAGAYAHRFGSWHNALERFVELVNKEDEEGFSAEPFKKRAISRKRSRSISWRKRFLVMRRDDFKCRLCGVSPALKPGIVLHVDHIKPYSKGGETILDNLQTLCEQCNIGKSDLLLRKES